MNELLVWWLVVEAVGLAAFPLTFALFHRLPDRGLTLAKPVGLLLLGYGLWMGALSGVFANSRGATLLVLVLLALVSLAAASRRRDEIHDFVRTGWRYVLLVEAMFAVVLAAGVFLRSFTPDIDSGEKPFELAFLNAVNRAETFPPTDPWLSGHSITYYYFGYVIVSALTKLSSLDTSVAFFFALSTVAALTWTALFGVAYNAVLIVRRWRPLPAFEEPPIAWRPIVFGLVAAAFVLVASNLEGVFELMARHGVGSQSFYKTLDICGLPGPYDCDAVPADCAEWYPTRDQWWWWATRIGSNFDIQEFPFFSLHFGDLHPHVLAMPLLVTLFAFSLQLAVSARQGAPPGVSWALQNPWRVLFLALLAGGLAFTDSWTIPLVLALIVGSLVLAALMATDRAWWRRCIDVAAVGLPAIAGMFLLFVPYYTNLEADTDGIALARTAQADSVPQSSEATGFMHLLIFWVPIFVPLLTYLAWRLLAAGPRALLRPVSAFALLPPMVPLAIWAFVLLIDGQLADELSERGGNLLTLATLALTLTAASLVFLYALRAREHDPAEPYVLLIASIAVLMLLGAELFYVDDALGFRANTVFRFWHQAWIILGLVTPFGIFRMTATWRLPRPAFWHTRLRWPVAARRTAWLALTAPALAASFVYPTLVTFDRTGGFGNDQTIQGLEFVKRTQPAEYEAIQWLNHNVDGTPVILEAFGNDFTAAARISSRTGLPTLVGWLGHELQWRGQPDPEDPAAFTFRLQDIARAFVIGDPVEAQAILARYDVEYVYIGPLELETYGDAGFAKFATFMDPVFRNLAVTIYRMR